MRRGYSNVTPLRRKLKRLNKHIENGVKPELEASLKIVAQTAVFNVPKDEGDLMRAIDYSLSSDGLAGVAGPAAKNAKVKRTLRTGGTSAFATRAAGGSVLSDAAKDKLFQFFKGYWIEFGTKGAPDRNIPPQPARPFMQPAWDVNASMIKARIKKAIDNQLKRASKL